MRWYILRTLLRKEVNRQLANRGGIALAVLLVVAALLMTFFSSDGVQGGSLLGGLETCFVDYGQEDAWIAHLRRNVPPELRRRVLFRNVSALADAGTTLAYPPGSGAIQVRSENVGGQTRYKVWLWHPGQDSTSLAVYEAWFWRESARFFQREAALVLEQSGQSTQAATQLPEIAQERTRLSGGMDLRSSVTTALVLFSLFFSCVYLLPSLMCEERERGVLLAQALSPATPREILAAKFLFYPVAGIVLAALIAGIARPAVLAQPFFWLVVTVAAFGSLGIGLTIACLAKTQRTASMGALCYMLVVAMLLFICQQGRIPGVPQLAVEYHCPRMLHAVLGDAVHWYHWFNLAAAAVLAIGWATLAAHLFRKRGWQ
ncbi:MAG TPA: ABC transporter permease [Gemmataceae bacterium]|nr:ABC transporter permease [Gemmataceae bacterium]